MDKRQKLESATARAKQIAALADENRWVVWSAPADDYEITDRMPLLGEIYHVYPDGEVIKRGGSF